LNTAQKDRVGVPTPSDQTQQKDKSPGSTDAGVKQEK
jgi:hypothetical protein